MVSIVDMLKRSEKFSLAFDRSMPIRFQQQFWQLIAFLDKHEITWFNDEPASCLLYTSMCYLVNILILILRR